MADAPLPAIDEARCANCGACVAACRFQVLVATEEGPRTSGPGQCLACGQCLAVCPTRAVSHPRLDLDAALELGAGPPVSPDQLRALLAGRRSVRHYQPRPVPTELLRELVAAAVLAPSGHNAQNWGFSLITSPDRLIQLRKRLVHDLRQLAKLAGTAPGRLLLRLGGMRLPPAELAQLRQAVSALIAAEDRGEDRIFWGAPALVVVHAPATDPTGGESCHYAIGNLMTMAVAHGLGTCVIGFLTEAARRDRVLRSLAGVPDDRSLHAACVVGYPAIRFQRSVPRSAPEIEFS